MCLPLRMGCDAAWRPTGSGLLKTGLHTSTWQPCPLVVKQRIDCQIVFGGLTVVFGFVKVYTYIYIYTVYYTHNLTPSNGPLAFPLTPFCVYSSLFISWCLLSLCHLSLTCRPVPFVDSHIGVILSVNCISKIAWGKKNVSGFVWLRVSVCVTTLRLKKQTKQKPHICAVSVIYCADLTWCLKSQSNCSESRWADFCRLSCFICCSSTSCFLVSSFFFAYLCMMGPTIVTQTEMRALFRGSCGLLSGV